VADERMVPVQYIGTHPEVSVFDREDGTTYQFARGGDAIAVPESFAAMLLKKEDEFAAPQPAAKKSKAATTTESPATA